MLSQKKSLNCKVLLNKMIEIINKNVEKLNVLVNIHYLLIFLRDLPEGHLSIEKADNYQNNILNELKGTKSFEKKFFLNN